MLSVCGGQLLIALSSVCVEAMHVVRGNMLCSRWSIDGEYCQLDLLFSPHCRARLDGRAVRATCQRVFSDAIFATGNWSPDGTLFDPPTCEAAVGTKY